MSINAKELSRIRFKPLPMVRKAKDIIGFAPDNVQFKVIIAGFPGSGKSTFTIKLMNLLANRNFKYKALFGNFEENTELGTITNKLRITGVNNENISFLEQPTLEEFYSELDTGEYKFAVIDSLSVIANTKNEVEELFNTLKTKYPTIPFFFVLHFTKLGQYYGSSYIEHMVDISLRAKDGKIETVKNRFIRSKTLPSFKVW